MMWKSFFLSMVGAFLTLCLIAATVNYNVDPYNIYQRQRTVGFNYFAGVAQNHERLFKSIALIERQPTVAVLGNSKADFAINPTIFDNNAYNAAVRNAQPKELLAFAHAAIDNNPNIKRLIVNVDYEMFAYNKTEMPGFDPAQLQSNHITVDNLFKTLLSADALDASYQTVALNRLYQRDFLSYDPNGKFTEPALYELFTFENSFIHNSNEMRDWAPIDPITYQQKFDDFAALVKLCRDHNVALTVIIMPVHRYHFDRYPKAAYERWQKKLADIAPVDDFSFMFIDNSTIDNEKNFWDAAHIKATAFERYICPIWR